jgi:fatty-acid desaturase
MHHTIKIHVGVETELHIFSALALDGGEWSASHRSHYTLTERAYGTGHGAGWAPDPVLMQR